MMPAAPSHPPLPLRSCRWLKTGLDSARPMPASATRHQPLSVAGSRPSGSFGATIASKSAARRVTARCNGRLLRHARQPNPHRAR